MPAFSYLDPPVLSFIVLPVLLAGALVWGTAAASRRVGDRSGAFGRARAVAAGAVLWMGTSWIVAGTGVLRFWEASPPPFALLLLAIVAMACALALSPLGRLLATGVPLWGLVGIQGFRLPLEVAMHGMFERGIMPEQMSYSGLNFDIVTGATALVVAALVWSRRGASRLVAAWNVLGLALLVNIVTIAILSTPRFQLFGADRVNVWVTYPPFIWLPTVMVLAALAGHLIVFRALRLQR